MEQMNLADIEFAIEQGILAIEHLLGNRHFILGLPVILGVFTINAYGRWQETGDRSPGL